MANKGFSQPGKNGAINHYDEHGVWTGQSVPNKFGGYNHFDNKGRAAGHSEPNVFGGYNSFDNRGRANGHSEPNMLGGYNHFDNRGGAKGTSGPMPGGGYSHNSGGCYIATAVYGSYDCPEVWTLRRYRDNTLLETWYGRLFIKCYYAISPSMVRRFGNTAWFQRLWRSWLDIFVKKLHQKGVEDTPYKDI